MMMLSFLFAILLAGPPFLAEETEALFVGEGKPVGVHSLWKEKDGFLEGTGGMNLLLADKGAGAGDFSIKARLRMEDQKASAAAFFLDQNYFGFEGAKETLFLNGPLFGGLKLLGASVEKFDRGAWIDFEAVRKGGELRFMIDSKVIHTVSCQGMRFERIGFEPNRSSMQIRHFSLKGNVIDAAPPMSRGCSLPLIDLAREKHRQVIVDREEGQYLGHPTTVLLEDGKTMICVYPKGHGRGAIVMKRSRDGGKTWSGRLYTPPSWATSKEVPTIYRVRDAGGVKRLILFSGLYPIRMAVSEDDGETWSELEPIFDFGGIVAMADVTALKTPGHYMALFHDDGRFIRGEGKATRIMTLYKTFSEDGGLTWSDPEVILARSDVGLCEPGMIRSPDGGQIAALLRENFRRRNSFVIFSDDEGKTWSEPKELPGSLTGDRHQLRYALDGRIVASFRDTTHVSETQGDWVGWVGTYEDIVLGREGQYRIRFMDNHHGWDCAYPGIVLLPDGTFAVTTYGHWVEGRKPFIVSVRFKLDELDGRRNGLKAHR